MAGRFSTYESPKIQSFNAMLNAADGTASPEDILFIERILSTFVNKQSSLFQKWVKVRITENNHGYNGFTKYANNNYPTSQLLVLTPLKIISLPTIQSPKRMKQFRIIDIISLFVEENSNFSHIRKEKSKSKRISKMASKQQRSSNSQNLLRVNNTSKKSKKSNKKNRNSKIIKSYPIIQHNPYRQEQQKPRHHATSSSSSLTSHSLSPPPSTSLSGPSYNDYAATDDENNYHRDDDEPLHELRELSKSKSKSATMSKSKSKSKSNQMDHYWQYHCCIKFHKLDVLEMSYSDIMNIGDTDILDIYFESASVAQEFLDILQFYLFTLYRGVPKTYKPKIEIIPNDLNAIDKYEDNATLEYIDDVKANNSMIVKANGRQPTKQRYPFVPSQVFIDRYVAYCDAMKIAALDCVIDYVIHTNDNDVFDVAAAFSHHAMGQIYARPIANVHHAAAFSDDIPPQSVPKLSNHFSSWTNADSNNIKSTKNVQQQQYVALGHALAFLKMYKKLSVDRLNTDDSNIATLMKIYETNPYIRAVEFMKCAIKKITMQSLSISLRAGVANLKELSIVDINLNRSVLKELAPGLENCNLHKLVMAKCNMSEKTMVYLFNSLLKTEQFKSMNHLNVSHNHCDKDGTKQLSLFIYKALNLHTLIVSDARIDGNIFFNGLHVEFYNPSTTGIKSHLQQLSYLDFSGNSIGEKGAVPLANFLQSAKSLQCLKLSRCNMSTHQLHKIMQAALSNNSGLHDIEALRHLNKENAKEQSNDNQSNFLQVDDEKKGDSDYYSASENEVSIDRSVHSEGDVLSFTNLVRSRSGPVQSMMSKSATASPLYPRMPSRKGTTFSRRSLENTKYINQLTSYRPTRHDIIQCQSLLRLTLDLSYNNLGTKGANIICGLLKNRLISGILGNYTIVSLSLAGNSFDFVHLSNILQKLHCCVCLESLNISDNVKQKMFSNNYFTKNKNNNKSDKGKKDKKSKSYKTRNMKKMNKKNKMKSMSKNDLLKDNAINNRQILGTSLVSLCRKATKLERLIMNSNDLEDGLEPFLQNLAYLSNLKFVDLSNNKFNDTHVYMLKQALSYNQKFIRALKIHQNKISYQCLIEYLQLLCDHSSLIDVTTCLPMAHISKYKKVKKLAATFTRLQSEASLNLRNNKAQYDIDKKMVLSLPVPERLERSLRLQCGQQFGIPLESLRGTIKYAEYNSRIPIILINLRNYLKSKGGFRTKEIFRFHADTQQFKQFKQDLNANNQGAKTSDMHSVANAIKAFYHDLPVKVLNNLNIEHLQQVESPDDIEEVINLIKEPYKSLFEWLLDLCVDIVSSKANTKTNKMTHRSMAVVLCPSLYNACEANPKVLRSVMEFTDFGIQWRAKYRKKYPAKYEEEIIEDPVVTKTKLQNQNKLLSNDDNEQRFAYSEIVSKWNSVMINVEAETLEHQAWNNCDERDVEDSFDENLYHLVREQKQNGDKNDGDCIKNCGCIHRVTFVLQYYKKWMKHRQINPHRHSTINLKTLENMKKLISTYNHKMIDFLQKLDNYGNVQLVNDFNHILRFHSSSNQIEDILNSLKETMGGCYKSQCQCLIRNNRNRMSDENRAYKTKIYFGYRDQMELCTQQLLDKIHCFVFHTFDTLRLTKSEKNQLHSIESKQKSPKNGKKSVLKPPQIKPDDKLTILKNLLSPKAEKLSQIRGLHRVKGTKFNSDISTFIHSINNNAAVLNILNDEQVDDEEDDDEEETMTLGQPFSHLDDIDIEDEEQGISNNAWFISRKYNTFKEEMLHNSINRIACDSWNDIYCKAEILHKSTMAKSLKSPSVIPITPNSPTPIPRDEDDEDEEYNLSPYKMDFDESKHGDLYSGYTDTKSIPIQHIIAILIYCDFDNLRNSLNDTFHPKSLQETVRNWKARHEEFSHWSQFLKEAVKSSSRIDMGNYYQHRETKFILYHSTSNQTYLSPKDLKFCYPISCNPHLSVVHTFSPAKNGIILALKSKGLKSNYFSCCWISDYANYDEHIIFNSRNQSNLYKVTNIMDKSYNYQKFWNAINMLHSIINGSLFDDYNTEHYDEEDIHCLSMLIQSQIERDYTQNAHLSFTRSMSSFSGRRRTNFQHFIPPYIDLLFTSFCKNYIFGQITLNPVHFTSIPIIYKHLFDQFGWIRIDLLCNLFINIDSIKVMNVTLNDNIFDSLYKFLSQFLNTRRREAIQKRPSVLDMIGSRNSRNSKTPNETSWSESIKPKIKRRVIKNQNDGTLSLTEIQFLDVDEKYVSCKQSVHKYRKNLGDIGWNMQYNQSSIYVCRQ